MGIYIIIYIYVCHASAHAQDNNNNETTEVQTLGVIRIQLIYSIDVLSKYSSLISHRPSGKRGST